VRKIEDEKLSFKKSAIATCKNSIYVFRAGRPVAVTKYTNPGSVSNRRIAKLPELQIDE